ncbi:MAG: hypothetical protein HY908_19710 [Myxococcales bacterium]|nr:hypothetical protein [Myxococcales bacterium]
MSRDHLEPKVFAIADDRVCWISRKIHKKNRREEGGAVDRAAGTEQGSELLPAARSLEPSEVRTRC